jgi:hypothetical protein
MSPNPPTNAMLTALSDVRAFIIYRKSDKCPVDTEGRPTDAQNRAGWMPPDQAQAWAAILGDGYGVGLVLHPELKVFCVDIDHALVNGQWSPLAIALCQQFAGCAIEVSLSGAALHIFGAYVGDMLPHRSKNVALGVELYHTARYIALTGTGLIGDVRHDATALLPQFIAEYFAPTDDNNVKGEWTEGPVWHVPGTADDTALLEKMRRSKSMAAIFSGERVTNAQLLDADAEALAKQWPGNNGAVYDASSADMSLANRLMWWTGGDCERTESIMRQSALLRDKWDHRADYLTDTICDALSFTAKNPPQAKATVDVPGNVGTEPGDKKRAMPTAPTATDDDPRPVILLSGGKFNKYTEQAEQLLASTIYVRGDNLVRIGRAADALQAQKVLDAAGVELFQDAVGTRRHAAQAVSIAASPGWLRRELMERAQFWKYDKRSNEWEPRDCPKEIAENIGDQKSWASFRPLIAITPVPILRPDMSVHQEPGYDAATGIFYQPTMAFPAIIPAPTRDDALAALNRLWVPFSEFPFATPESASAFLSHCITSVLRASFDTSPIYVYTAPIRASGKTLLASMPTRIARSGDAATNPFSENEELRKVLFSSLLAGDAALMLDNVPSGSKVEAPVLCGFSTSPVYADRILGASERRAIPNRLTVSLTGNNITPVADMARRALVVRLDVNAESARGRKFLIKDLRTHVLQNRAQLIVDVFTIVRAYAFAGYPEVAHPLESFEQWSRIARDPLVALGMVDPVATQATETEDDVAPLQGAFAAIAVAAASLNHRFTSAQLAQLTVGFGGQGGQALRDALLQAGCEEPTDPKQLGVWLREHRDRVAGGRKLARRDKSRDWELRKA